MMVKKSILSVLLAPVFILVVPLVAMQFTNEVAWDFADFAIAWALMAGVGFAYKLATRRTGNVAYRAAVGLALATAFILIWINLAVGLIGSEDNPANLLYLGVLAVVIIGVGIARFEPLRMARALFATAFAQALVPVIALIIWQPKLTFGVVKVFVLNTFFVLLFVGSALLFRHAHNGSDALRGD